MKKFLCFVACIVLTVSSPVFSASAKKGETALDIDAKAAVLMDASTGEVLFSKNEHKKLYPASVTKIMPLLLVMEAIDSGKLSLTDKITASAVAAGKGGSQIWLKEGEQMTVDELLKAAVISSANDACTALGEHIAGSEDGIVKMMNDRAKELGMNDTNFVNCTGLDDDTTEHLTSAYDIALMSKQLLSHERIQNYTTVWMDSLRDGATQLVNTNKLVRFYKGTTGLKTGTTTKAGHCISASAQRDGLHLIAVVMGSSGGSERFEAAKTMLNWGFANYETVTPEFDMSLITEVRVIKGIDAAVMPKLEQIKSLTLESGQKSKIQTEIDLAADVEAPVEQGQVLGTVKFTIDGKSIAEYKLISETAVRRLKVTDIMYRLISSLTRKSMIDQSSTEKTAA
ncbi:MAG: D-alanyl-D-alanine carboxypeptidase [Faecalibacterium sp.]|nr:D-alanyl-D-alanine carboxypeptidase [Ruminococcus sp.]MCM1484964.1 D-alanyl-D-alanine carboxypeptidase [Faecalibacterium sp.]